MPPRVRRPDKPGRVVSSPPVALLLAAIVFAGAIAYANSLSAPFILDDEDSIVRNPHITSLSPLSQAMGAPAQSSLGQGYLVGLGRDAGQDARLSSPAGGVQVGPRESG